MPAPYPKALQSGLAALQSLPTHHSHDQRVRDLVRQRAADVCEYCLMPTSATKFQIEHIIPRAQWANYRAGAYPALRPRARFSLSTPDHLSNYAWSCFFCNNAKGGRSRSAARGRLFDPRFDHWPDHFGFLASTHRGIIVGKTRIGLETVEALDFNSGGPEGAATARFIAIIEGRYPPPHLIAAYRL